MSDETTNKQEPNDGARNAAQAESRLSLHTYVTTVMVQLRSSRSRRDTRQTETKSPTRSGRMQRFGWPGSKGRKNSNGPPTMANPDQARELLTQNFKDNPEGAQYKNERKDLVDRELSKAWDADARSRASPAEREAQKIIVRIREGERVNPHLFGDLPSEAVPPQESVDMGGKFLKALPRIKQSKIYEIACEMPKGCHQHLHFNSEIPPEELFPLAREVEDTMFIRSLRPLLNEEDFLETEIVFQVLPKDTVQADIFSKNYNPAWKNTTNSPWMLWVKFRSRFPSNIDTEDHMEGLDQAESWAREKMVITSRMSFHKKQTHNRAWACFNQGTRAFKGLLGYETAYRWYIGHAIDSMIRDKVMYAELRPMLMDKTLPSDDGLRQLDHNDQMKIIVDEVIKKQDELKARGEIDKFPFGLKIIYCTPRSIPLERMKTELQDCLNLKLQFPDLICGFDLVGAEDRPNCISYYSDLLTAFTKTCKDLNVSIPYFFHAGETLLDTGGSDNPLNSNLYDSLLLNSKRIGHGYALLKHPLLIEKYKAANICLELCPISNELLQLCGNAREHPYPALLAAGLHCTLNADNPSLFRGASAGTSSSLSFEFYQVMVGDPRMSIHGWKQLAEWSIEHSCLSEEEIRQAKEIHAREWEGFCKWVVATFGGEEGGEQNGMDLS